MDLLFELARADGTTLHPDHPRHGAGRALRPHPAHRRRPGGRRRTHARRAGCAMNLAFRLARREMRSGLGGFRLFIACLALGVGGDRRHPVVQPRRRGRLARRRPRDPGRRRRRLAALSRGDAGADRLHEVARPARALDRQPRHGAAGQARRAGDPGAAQGGRAGLSALRHASSSRTACSLADALAEQATACGARWSRRRRCGA